VISSRIKEKLNKLRAQSESERLRVATIITVASGTVVTLTWLLILLPLQLSLTRPDKDSDTSNQIKQTVQNIFNRPEAVQANLVEREQAVSGARKSVTSPSPSAQPAIDRSGDILPVASSAPDPSVAPVEITDQQPTASPSL
jgi:hypothetical protein